MLRTLLAFSLLVASSAMVWPIVMEMGAVERCRDADGSYNYASAQCDFRVKHPGLGLWQAHGVTILGSIALGVAGCFLLFRRDS